MLHPLPPGSQKVNIEIVGHVGLDLETLNNPYHQQLLQFLPGFGPNKSQALINKTTVFEMVIKSKDRKSLQLSFHDSQALYTNCASFFRFFQFNKKYDPVCITRIGYNCKIINQNYKKHYI